MKIHIKTPCHENWDGMSQKDKGRHCQQCDKVVMDFTNMDNFGILKTLNQNSNTCGRFTNQQLQTELELPVLPNPWLPPFRKMAFGSLLLGKMALAQTDSTEVAHEPPLVMFHATDNWQQGFTIKGKIVQPESKSKSQQALALHFELDSFTITIPLDSQNFSFEVPKGTAQKQVKIGVTTADSFYQLDAMPLAFVSEGVCEITMEYKDVWTSRVEPPRLNLRINTADWGWGRDIIATTIEVVTTGMVTMGDYSLPEELPVDGHLFDTNPLKKAKQKAAFKKLVIHEKRQSSRWWWLLPGFLVFALGAWMWRKKG